MATTEIFPLCIGHSCTTLWVKKFALNRSILYGFGDIHMFSFSTKFQDGHQKWRKLKFSPLHRILWYYPVGQNSLKIALSLTVFEIFTLFHFLQNPRWPPKVVEIEIFPLGIGYGCYYPAGQKFAQNQSISYGF